MRGGEIPELPACAAFCALLVLGNALPQNVWTAGILRKPKRHGIPQKNEKIGVLS